MKQLVDLKKRWINTRPQTPDEEPLFKNLSLLDCHSEVAFETPNPITFSNVQLGTEHRVRPLLRTHER